MTDHSSESDKKKKPLFQSVQDTAVFFFSIIFLFSLVFFFSTSTDYLIWWVTTPLLLFCVYYLLPQEKRERIQNFVLENFFVMATMTTVWLVAVAIIFWTVINFWWQPKMDSLNTQVLLNAKDIYITVTYTPTISMDGQPNELLFSLANNSKNDQSVQINSTIPITGNLLFVDSPSLTVDPLMAHEQVSQTLSLIPSSKITETKTISFTTSILDSPINNKIAVKLNFEEDWRFRIRLFVNNTINKASPLIILLAFLVPVLSKLLQKQIDEQQKVFEKERTEKAKNQAEKANNLVEYYCNLLTLNQDPFLFKENNATEAVKSAFEDLKDLEYLEDKEKEAVEILFEVAYLSIKHDDGVEEIVQKMHNAGKLWPDPCGAAYLIAHRNIELTKSDDNDTILEENVEKLKRALDFIYQNLPIPEISSGLQERIAELEARKETSSPQSREWPTPSLAPKPNSEKTIDHLLNRFNKPAKPNNDERKKLLHPFLELDGNKDILDLFITRNKQRVFWPGHKIFNELRNTNGSCFVYGPPGSGRSTLAHAYIYFSPNKQELLGLYINEKVPFSEINIRFIRLINDFVMVHPTYLPVGAKLELLAALLVAGLGTELTHVSIEQALSTVNQLDWQQEETKEDKERWHRMGQDRLRSLRKATQKLAASKNLHKSIDKRLLSTEIVTVARALRFKRVSLILDIDVNAIDWMKNRILPNLHKWQGHGLQLFIFTPIPLPELSTNSKHQLQNYQIKWKRTEIEELIDWRYSAFYPRENIFYRFDTEELEKGKENLQKLIRVSQKDGEYTPRAFMELWQSIIPVLDPVSARIRQTDIDLVSRGQGIQ